MGKLSATAVVEEFGTRWQASDLAGKMPEPILIDNRGKVELTRISVLDQHRGQGFASRVLKMLTDLCDANEVEIELVARPLTEELPAEVTGGCRASLDVRQLTAWYQRKGFVNVSVPGEDTHTMIRRPHIRVIGDDSLETIYAKPYA